MPRTDANEMRTRAVASVERSELLRSSSAATTEDAFDPLTFILTRLQK